MLRTYYPSLTKNEFRRWSMFDIDDALEVITQRSFRGGYPIYALHQTLLAMFSGKDSPKVEPEELLPAFANPFKEEGQSRDYHPEFKRLMRKLIDAQLAPEWLCGAVSIADLYKS